MSCKEEGKGISKTRYEGSAAAKQELVAPEIVIFEQFGLHGEIQTPKVYSPREQFKVCSRSRAPDKVCVLNVLKELVTAEKVARRQYDEVLIFNLLKPYVEDLTYIRNDEYEHQVILECIIRRLTAGSAAAPSPVVVPAKLEGVTVTSQTVKDIYLTILDRFGQEEQNGIKNYGDLLQKVKESLMLVEPGTDAEMPLIEMRRKITKILTEEKIHLDTIDALKQMVKAM